MLHSYCQIQNTMKEQRNALNSVMHVFGRRVMLLAVRLSPEMAIHNSVCGSVSSIKTLSLFLLSKYIWNKTFKSKAGKIKLLLSFQVKMQRDVGGMEFWR